MAQRKAKSEQEEGMPGPWTPYMHTRPARIDPGCMWVAVEAVHVSDGQGPHERTFGVAILSALCTEDAAVEAAKAWFDATDQSEACDVTFSVERSNGAIVSHRVVIEIAPRARIKREPGASAPSTKEAAAPLGFPGVETPGNTSCAPRGEESARDGGGA